MHLPVEIPVPIAVLDDYQHVARSFADWSALENIARIHFFHDHIANEAALIQRLLPFRVVCVMRERTPLTGNILSQLPNLELIVSTGMRNASIDIQAAIDAGISVAPTRYHDSGAPEMTWALLLAMARHIVPESLHLRGGGWQKTVGADLNEKTIGIIGLGRVGSRIARYAEAFNMNILAWSENLTKEKAAAQGARLVTKDTLFRESDFVTIHLVLSPRSKGIVGSKELRLMKPTAYFINTSRGPLVNEQALIEILREKKIAGAAIDVFDREPLLADHPFRTLDNVLATPHIGYVTEDTYRLFYTDTVKAITEWLAKKRSNQ